MLELAQKFLHEKTTVSQLDAIGRLLGLKSQHNMTRACFDAMMAIIGGAASRGSSSAEQLVRVNETPSSTEDAV